MSIRFLSQKKSAELIIRRLETELNQRQQQQKQQSISCVSLSSDEGDDDSLVLFASTYDGGGVSTLLVTREDSLVLLPPFVPPLVSCASIPDSKLHFMLDSAGNVFYLTGPLKKGAASTPTPTNPTTTTSAIVGTHQLQYQQLAFSEKSKPLPDHEFSSSVKIKSMSCGMGHSLFLSTDGRLFGFGDNDNGQLGDDSIPSSSSASSPSNSRLVARLITSLFGTPISKICCGGKHSLILTSFGSVYSFGNNAFGQLGVGDRVQRNSPSRISILNDRKIVDISCGEEHSVILTSTGTVFTCGAGNFGQLGHGSKSFETLPKAVIELFGENAIKIQCGRMHTFATMENGKVYAFGLNDSMQLGLATNSNSLMISVPTPVVEVNGSDVTIICGWVDSTLVIANTLLKQSPNFAGGVASDDYNEAIIFQRIQYVKSILSETRVLDDKTGAVLQKLQEDISKLFSSSSILNRSFVLKKAYPHTKSGAVIDIALVRSFFSELSCVDKLVSNICTNTPALTTTPHSFLQILIGSLKSNLTKLSNAMSFSLVSPIDRCRGVLIACLAEHEVLENILGEIFDVCSNLGEDGWDFISQWLRDAVNGGVEETASAGFKRHISKAVTAAPQPQSASSTSSFSLAVATPWDFYEFRRDLIVQVFSTLVDALNVKIGKSYTDREKDVLIKYAELTEKFYTINNIGFLTDRKLLLASEAGLPSVVKPATKIKIMHPRSSTRQHQNSSSNPPRNPQKEFGYPSSQSIIPHSKFANATISAGIDIATAYSLIRNDRRGGGSGSFPGGGLPYPSLPGIGIPGALSTGMDAISGLGAAILAQALGVGIRGPPSAAASADQAQSPAGLSGSNSNPAPASNSMNQNALLSEMLGGAGLNADLIAQSLQGGNARVVATHVGTQIGGRQHGNETFPPIPPEMLRRAQASGGTLIRGVITINPATMQMSVEFQAADGSPLGAQQAANVVDGVGGGGIGVPTRGAVADDVSRGNEGDDEGGGGASIGMEEDGDDDGSENSNGIDLLPDMENMADFAEFLGGLQAEESRDEDSNMYIDEDGGGDDDDEEEGGLTEAVAGEMANAFMGFLQSGNGPDQAAMAQRIQSLLNMRHSATSLNSNNANPASTNSTATRLSSNSSAPTLVVTPGHGGTSELSSLLPTPTSASSVPSLSVQSGSASSAVGATDASASNSLLSHIYSPSSRPTSSVGSSSIINRQSSSSVISNSPVAPAPVAASNHNRIHHNARPHNTASNPQLSAMLESLLNMNPLHSTIVQYPHLYDLGVKLSLLQLDSEMKQQERRNVSLFANIMSNRRHQAGAPTPEQQMFSKLELRRDHVWEDTLRIVGSDIAPDGTSNTHSAESSSSHSNNNSTNIAFSSSSHITSSVVGDLKKPLRVSFLGEEGLDEGGVSNEYMQLFFGLADKKNLFTVVNENPAEGPVLWFDPAAPTESCLRDYRIIGRVLGLAIYNSCLCSISFPQIMYKMLLGWHVGFEDFIKFRPQLARGFAEIMNFEGKDEDEEIFGLNFTVLHDGDGSTKKVVELKEGGTLISVSQKNRAEYIKLRIEWELGTSIRGKLNAVRQGMMEVCDGVVFKMFTPYDLEQLIRGSVVYDFYELESVTRYKPPYSSTHPVIRRFWKVLHSLSEEYKRLFLKFVTGTDRIPPVSGLKGLRFAIQPSGSVPVEPEAMATGSASISPESARETSATTTTSATASFSSSTESQASSSSIATRTRKRKLRDEEGGGEEEAVATTTMRDAENDFKRHKSNTTTSSSAYSAAASASSSASNGNIPRVSSSALLLGLGGYRLPSAHTCHNLLDLPAYPSEELLRASLLYALENGREGFLLV